MSSSLRCQSSSKTVSSVEVALLLLVLVIVELVVSVFCLTRWAGVAKELRMVEVAMEGLNDALRMVAAGVGGESVPVELPTVADGTRLASATEILSNASDDDVAKALELLRGMDLGK